MEKSEQAHRIGNGTRLNRQFDELARGMAGLAHKIRDLTVAAFEYTTVSGTMQKLFASFKEVSNADLTELQFADMFAQTLAYGLFAARYNHTEPARFQLQHVTSAIPRTNAFLQQLFASLSGPELRDEPFSHYVGELVNLLAETDVDTALAGSNQCTCQEDPLIYFYETFLEQYDPQLRELRGVYYTPEPVVSYIVRSLDFLLRSHFNCQDGLAGTVMTTITGTDEGDRARVIVLDPACGSGVFLHAVIKHIWETFRQTTNAGKWQGYVHEHLLPRLVGFELLMAPYMMAHLKLGAQLAALDLPEPERSSWAYNLQDEERLNIYPANTLDEVGDVLHYGKRDLLVILGNPPYAGHSVNKGKWITGLLETYKEGCPELKKPAQAKWLSDDYVKFMRFAQWHIEQASCGVVAFVTNHSYLDNPTFRSMRRSLLRSFDEIYILDLHGNSKKKEQAPGGSKDENVFDIQQGVAISIFVKRRGARTPSHATVHHADLWGAREVYAPGAQGVPVLTGGKYCWLAKHELASTPWTILNPQAPFYLFTPRDGRYLAEYEAGWSVPDIFRPNGDPAPGIVTCHDEFAISWTKGEAISKVERFLSTKTESEARQLFRLCSQDQWQYDAAKNELGQGTWQSETTEVLYRPFDRRWTVFNRHVAVHRRERVMRHMLSRENTGLAIGRAGQVIDQGAWDIVFCTRYITEFNLYRRGGNNLFPLYLYSATAGGERRVNLAPEFIADFAARLGMNWVTDGRGDLQQTFGPEDVLAYMYAVFYSPAYRQRYAPFLKIDFPRLPLTGNVELFRVLCALGDRLIALHTMQAHAPQITSFPAAGNNLVHTHETNSGMGAVSRKSPFVCVSARGTTDTTDTTDTIDTIDTNLFGSPLVELVRYTEQDVRGEQGRVWINARQYFDNVPKAAWNFSIGGYQICKKWLKDRKGRKLDDAELWHYQQIVAVLAETSRLMNELDRVIEEYGGWPLGKERVTVRLAQNSQLDSETHVRKT